MFLLQRSRGLGGQSVSWTALPYTLTWEWAGDGHRAMFLLAIGAFVCVPGHLVCLLALDEGVLCWQQEGGGG